MRTDTSTGTWMNFEQILGIESGYMTPTLASTEGAKNICTDCLKKGPKHVRLCPRSKRIQFRYVQESDSKQKRTTHATSQKESTEPDRSLATSATPAASQAQPTETPEKTASLQNQVAIVQTDKPKAAAVVVDPVAKAAADAVAKAAAKAVAAKAAAAKAAAAKGKSKAKAKSKAKSKVTHGTISITECSNFSSKCGVNFFGLEQHVWCDASWQ